jgi:hypothetical protein
MTKKKDGKDIKPFPSFMYIKKVLLLKAKLHSTTSFACLHILLLLLYQLAFKHTFFFYIIVEKST